MALFEKRVSALAPAPIVASISAMPCARAACRTSAKISSQRTRVSSSDSFIRAADLDVVKSRRTRSVPGAHHLLGLALAAIGRTPQGPMRGSGDRGARVPEFRADAAVARVFQQAHALAVADLPGDLAAELEVVALVVNRPALVGFHVDGMV